MNRGHLTEPSPYESGSWGTVDRPCPSERTLGAHVDGQLDAARAEAVEEHLDGCSACARVVRRAEGLSNLLRSWEASRRVESPSRLSSAVLRTVAPEAAALRRESSRASVRAWAFAAAVLVAIGAGVAAARWMPLPSPAAASLDVAAVAAVETGASPYALAPLSFGTAFAAAATSPDTLRAEAGAPPRETPPPTSLAAFEDDDAKRAFANYLPFVATERALGEPCYVVGDRALPAWAAAPFARVRRLEAMYAELARSLAEPVTVDPSAKGLSILDVVPLPAVGELPSFVARLPLFVEPASRRGGGLAVRPLPGRAGSSESAPDAIDLEAAVAARIAVLRSDVRGDATTVTLEVGPTTASILVPAGELLTGGGPDRVVTEGVWLPASGEARRVVLPCAAVSRSAGASATPLPTGMIAGPELRGLLAYRAERDGVLALVDGQIADAALDRGVEGRQSLLALYDRASPEVISARALAHEFASRFAAADAGFVVADPDGRFQGLEFTTLTGTAGRRVLERLLVGYLIESRTRTTLDGPRSGVAVEVALSRLVERAPRLAATTGARPAGSLAPAPSSAGPALDGLTAPNAPRAPLGRLSGLEPRSGVRIEGVPAESARPPLVSGLVPGIR